MERRLEDFVKALAHKDEKGKIIFPNLTQQHFYVHGDDHLIDLPVSGSVSLECDVRDDTIEVNYFLVQANRQHDSVIKVLYTFTFDEN